jgi:RimJ/RimL family protein N-acetyltransferase
MRLEGEKVVLREKRLEDAWDDYRWRTDPELAKLDASTPLSIEYEEYLRSHSDELDHPLFSSHSFSIEARDGTHIGNCMYYDLNHLRKEAEMGIMIGDRRYWNEGYGQDAVVTLLGHVFTTVGLRKVYLHTLEWNQRARRCFQKCGFREVGTVRRGGHTFVRMEATRSEWEKRPRRPLSAGRIEQAQLDTGGGSC